MSDKYEGLRRAAEELVTAMETCHECKGLLVFQKESAHCEDCSYDCESHDSPDCTPIYVLHARLKSLLHYSAPKAIRVSAAKCWEEGIR